MSLDVEKLISILRKAGIEVKLEPPKEIKGEEVRPKDENIRILEDILNKHLQGYISDVVEELKKYGFRVFNEEDYYKLLESPEAEYYLEPDYPHSKRFLCGGLDWFRVGDTASGSMCIWVKDGKYYYCRGVIIYENDKMAGTTVICERIA